MILSNLKFLNFKPKLCHNCGAAALRRCFSQSLEEKYNDTQKEKILKVVNEANSDTLLSYDITKVRLRRFNQWKDANGQVKKLTDIESIDGFTEKTATRWFNSILEGPSKNATQTTYKIKGQILTPTLSESVRQSCQQVLSLYINVNSISWTLIERQTYEVVKWQYHSIDYPDGKRLQITDVLSVAWEVIQKLPSADIYVMKAEATTLRASGSDPNNPKVIAVNLQKAQLVAMIVALLNARSYNESTQQESTDSKPLKQTVYFLRSTLPFRLYGTLVGNEKVSTDQTVEMILQETNEVSPGNTHVFVPEKLRNMYRVQKDLQKDMLGHCLLLALTFMDLCIYKNQEKICKLINNKRE